MATYTPNYGLHQWVPEDKFVREDFNHDNARIDTVIYNVINRLESINYNIYYLTLQYYYEGRSNCPKGTDF